MKLKAEEKLKRKNAAIIQVIREMKALKENMLKKYTKLLKIRLDIAASKAIDMFYEDEVFMDSFGNPTNEPRVYRRNEDLYNVYEIVVDDSKGTFNVEIDYKLLHYHGRKKKEIYENVFIRGYHGGYDKPINGYHPDPGTPWWYYTMTSDGENSKGITDGWVVWLREAPQSPSPHDFMISELNKEIEDLKRQYNDEILQKGDKIISKIGKYI